MDKDTGGPAFPTKNYKAVVPVATGYAEGMTLRDYFAAKAVPISYQFWMNDYFHPDASDAEVRAEDDRADFSPDMKMLVAETAYEMADAMLKARGQE
jgi:hypothetical protein